MIKTTYENKKQLQDNYINNITLQDIKTKTTYKYTQHNNNKSSLFIYYDNVLLYAFEDQITFYFYDILTLLNKFNIKQI